MLLYNVEHVIFDDGFFEIVVKDESTDKLETIYVTKKNVLTIDKDENGNLFVEIC